jgi:hypothetical protein
LNQENTKTMNALGYLIYLVLAYIITVHVGLVFYRNGRAFIVHLMHGDEDFADAINLGYCAIMIVMWEPIHDLAGLVNNLSFILSRIVLGLGVMHYINMGAIYILSKKHKYQPNNLEK